MIFALDILVLRELDNSLESQFPDLRHKMRLFQEIAGLPESVPDCADEKTEQAFRRVTELIYETVNEHREVLLELADT